MINSNMINGRFGSPPSGFQSAMSSASPPQMVTPSGSAFPGSRPPGPGVGQPPPPGLPAGDWFRAHVPPGGGQGNGGSSNGNGGSFGDRMEDRLGYNMDDVKAWQATRPEHPDLRALYNDGMSGRDFRDAAQALRNAYNNQMQTWQTQRPGYTAPTPPGPMPRPPRSM